MRQSGYGFVHFAADKEGVLAAFNAARALHGTSVDGVQYNVEPSKNLLKLFQELQAQGVMGASDVPAGMSISLVTAPELAPIAVPAPEEARLKLQEAQITSTESFVGLEKHTTHGLSKETSLPLDPSYAQLPAAMQAQYQRRDDVHWFAGVGSKAPLLGSLSYYEDQQQHHQHQQQQQQQPEYTLSPGEYTTQQQVPAMGFFPLQEPCHAYGAQDILPLSFLPRISSANFSEVGGPFGDFTTPQPPQRQEVISGHLKSSEAYSLEDGWTLQRLRQDNAKLVNRDNLHHDNRNYLRDIPEQSQPPTPTPQTLLQRFQHLPHSDTNTVGKFRLQQHHHQQQQQQQQQQPSHRVHWSYYAEQPQQRGNEEILHSSSARVLQRQEQQQPLPLPICQLNRFGSAPLPLPLPLPLPVPGPLTGPEPEPGTGTGTGFIHRYSYYDRRCATENGNKIDCFPSMPRQVDRYIPYPEHDLNLRRQRPQQHHQFNRDNHHQQQQQQQRQWAHENEGVDTFMFSTATSSSCGQQHVNSPFLVQQNFK
jgi:hypothetical protein